MLLDSSKINRWQDIPDLILVIFDLGSECKGVFRDMLNICGIYASPTTMKNPQANAICERLHQTITDILHPLLYLKPPLHVGEAEEIVDDTIAAAAHASHTSLHLTMKLLPGAIIFNRDMLLDIPVLADLHMLHDKRQQYVDKNLEQANKKKVAIDYQPGDKVLKLVYKLNKLEPRAVSPYLVEKVHCNETLTIKLNTLVTQKIKIRHLRPWNK